jgi:hypothetical protein
MYLNRSTITLIRGAHNNDVVVSEAVIILQFDVVATKAMGNFNLVILFSLKKFNELGVGLLELLVVQNNKNLVSDDK